MLKKAALILILVVLTLSLIGFILYKQYAPDIIANELLKETEPVFLPKKVNEKIKKIKVQTNQLSSDIIKDIHKSDITLDQLLHALDGVTEPKANALLDDINKLGKLNNPDQVFDLVKKQFPVDFDVEPLRAPFREKADVQVLQKVVQKANEYRDNKLIDFESAKAIVKRILIEKEKEFNQYIKPN